MAKFKVVDKPGRKSVDEMREVFEKSIRATPQFRDNTPLGVINVNGRFSHYADPDTDTMWLGFALGLRAADRLQAAAVQDRRSPPPYTELENEILESVRAGRAPLYDRFVFLKGDRIAKLTDRSATAVIEGRLQALRKKGLIVFLNKAEANGRAGWHIANT